MMLNSQSFAPARLAHGLSETEGRAPSEGVAAAPAHNGCLINSRVRLLDIATVRAVRGCDAETVLSDIGDATRPNFLRWVFNMATHGDGRIRELRFWRREVLEPVNKWAAPGIVISEILGGRQRWSRGELEIAFTLNATTIARLINAGQLEETNHQVTGRSVAAFLERRLQ